MKPLKRYKRKHIYRGYCFDLVLDRVKWPNNRIVERDLILHDGVSVMVPVKDKNHIILLRQYRYGSSGYMWEVPAGTIDKKDPPLVCAKRELEEEIGYRAMKWKKIATCYASPGFNTEKLYCYAASDLIKTQTALEDDEVLYPKVMSHREVRRMMRLNHIQDAKTIVALHYYYLS